MASGVVEIAANAERRIKNATSRRTLPLHPHLIELGLPEFAAGPAGERLFPDLTRKSSRGNLGDSLQYRWQKLLTAQLGADAAGKKFHFFRHTMTDHLRRDPEVPEWVRRDILGHAATDVEDLWQPGDAGDHAAGYRETSSGDVRRRRLGGSLRQKRFSGMMNA